MKALIPYRARNCRRALIQYDTAFAPENCPVDFLANARHWCDRNGHSFLELDCKAFRPYREERLVANRRMP